MNKVKKFLVNKNYQQQLLNNAVERDGVKYVRGVVASYPEDWIFHPLSGASNYEDWEWEVDLPISKSGKVLHLPVHSGLVPDENGVPDHYEFLYIIIDNELVGINKILTPIPVYQ